MKLHEDLHRFDMFRQPDWRINRVLSMLDRYPTPGRCRRTDDEYIRETRRFLAMWRGIDDPEERARVMENENPGLYHAHKIYLSFEEEPEHTLYLQARLLARQDYNKIAIDCCTSPVVVDWYEKVFFNIMDRIDSRDWITKYVLMPAFSRNQFGSVKSSIDDEAPTHPFKDITVAKPFLDASLKLFAYFGGTYVVDAMIAGFQSGKPCNSQDDVDQWHDRGMASTVRRRSHQASLQFEVNKYNVMELFAVHTRIIEIEKSADNAESQRSATERHIKAMIEDIPWAVGDDGEKLLAGTELGRFDEGAAELRDDDILLVSTGKTPKRLLDPDEVLTALPPPRKKKPTLDGTGTGTLLPEDK